MTGNVLIDLAISLGGVILLVGLARVIFGARRAVVNEAAAAERLAFDEPDFVPDAWLAGEGGAVAVSRAGEAALVVTLGDGLATRRVRLADLRSRRDGADVVIEAPDHAFPRLVVTAASEEDAERWTARLAAPQNGTDAGAG